MSYAFRCRKCNVPNDDVMICSNCGTSRFEGTFDRDEDELGEPFVPPPGSRTGDIGTVGDPPPRFSGTLPMPDPIVPSLVGSAPQSLEMVQRAMEGPKPVKTPVVWDPSQPRTLWFPDGSVAEGPNVSVESDAPNGVLIMKVSYRASGGQAQEFAQRWAAHLDGNSELASMMTRLTSMMGQPLDEETD